MVVNLLEDGDELFRLAIEASPAAVIVTDVEGRIRFANAETLRIFGFQANELLGMSINGLIPRNCAKTTRNFTVTFSTIQASAPWVSAAISAP